MCCAVIRMQRMGRLGDRLPGLIDVHPELRDFLLVCDDPTVTQMTQIVGGEHIPSTLQLLSTAQEELMNSGTEPGLVTPRAEARLARVGLMTAEAALPHVVICEAAAFRRAGRGQAAFARDVIRQGGSLQVGVVASLDEIGDGWPVAAGTDKVLELFYRRRGGEPQAFVNDGYTPVARRTDAAKRLAAFAALATQQAKYKQEALDLIT